MGGEKQMHEGRWTTNVWVNNNNNNNNNNDDVDDDDILKSK